jgi:hypothetical protein
VPYLPEISWQGKDILKLAFSDLEAHDSYTGGRPAFMAGAFVTPDF